jgi:soluble lytic murein transglycosylase
MKSLSVPLLFLLVFALLPLCARAEDLDTQNYRRAFNALDAGHPDQAYTFAIHGRDPVLNKALRGAYMAQTGNSFSFDDIASFVSDNPEWPGLRAIVAAAEQKIPPGATPDQIINWFTAHQPQSWNGFYRYIDALNADGRTQEAVNMVRNEWIDSGFTAGDMATFLGRYQKLLDHETHWARLDHLLWRGDVSGAQHMYAYVDADERALAEARIALAGEKRKAASLLASVPEALRHDPGLLYERLRWNVRNNRDEDSIEILIHAPDAGDPKAWWDQREIVIHRLIAKRDYVRAYRLAVDHGQKEGASLLQGEFLAGWLALRFLNQPDEALAHFQALYDNASTPISRARGAYWLGRTYEALDEQNSADGAYEDAAALNLTYYGQLAIARLADSPEIEVEPEPEVPADVRQAFYARDIIAAIGKLYALGETGRAHSFFKAATDSAFKRSDFALLVELARKINRPDFSIEAAKASTQKNMLMPTGGYPLLGRPLPSPPDPAFSLALIRQESMFNPDAESAAGAIGLMQLMPSTAKAVARKLKVRFRKSNMENPDYNLRLGTAFIQNQLNIYDGSYVLALAGYNAGSGRVHEWMQQIGDPRQSNIDPIDWVEMIPINETRNYVQRIIESLQIYRALLNGGDAPLLILKDLKR